MRRPSTESLRYLDASSLTSDEFNRYARALTKDITNVYNASNTLEQNLLDSIQLVTQENLFLYNKLTELQSQFQSLSDSIATGYSNKKVYYKTYYNGSDLISDSVFHDQLFGLVTLPQTDLIASVFKDYDKEFLAKNINIQYTIKDQAQNTLETGTLTDEENLINVIDRDLSSYWTKTIVEPNTVTAVDFQIKIDSSTRIIPTMLINAIAICPYPIFGLELVDISYVDSTTNSTIKINRTFPADPNGVFDLPTAPIGNVKYIIPTISAKSVLITLRQSNYIPNGNENIFFFGIRNINIEFLNLASETASFVTLITLPAKKYFSSIEEPEVIDYNMTDIPVSDLVRHELYLGDSLDSPFGWNREIRSSVNTIAIKTTMTKQSNMIPYITGLKVEFNIK